MEYQLPEPQGFMTAKAYKSKIVEPLIKRLKALVKNVLARCYEAWDSYYRLNNDNGRLYRENEQLTKINDRLSTENTKLKDENKDYNLLRKVFGKPQLDNLVEQAKQSKQCDKRFRNNNYER